MTRGRRGPARDATRLWPGEPRESEPVEWSERTVEPLEQGDTFPTIEAETAEGETIVLPDDLDFGHVILLFYRGHW